MNTSNAKKQTELALEFDPREILVQKKLKDFALEFDLREVRIQTEDRREMYVRFEGGRCVCFGSRPRITHEAARREIYIERDGA